MDTLTLLATNWPDVADSAVKIGLGALIGGASSFWLAKLTHGRAATSEYVKRRCDHIEKVLADMNLFQIAYQRQRALFKSLRNEPNEGDRETWTEEFNKLDEELRTSFERFGSASGILLMFGERTAAEAMDNYEDAANAWYDWELADSLLATMEDVNARFDRIDTERVALFDALHAAYAKTGK